MGLGLRRNGLESEDMESPLPMDPRMTLNGRRILVVEDALLDAGAEVLGPAATVEEALALLEDSEIGGAVLDINLAGQLSTPVADLLAERGVPFVVATGYGAAGLPEHHRGVPVLAKPYDPRELVETLEQICG